MKHLLFALALPLAALDNAVRVEVVVDQTNRPISVGQVFVEGQIPQYAQPYINGTAAAVWQNDHAKRWPDGSLKRAEISFRVTATAGETVTIDFRNNANPCSSGVRAECDAAALSQADMLAFAGGTWSGSMTLTANPAGSTTPCTFDVRAALAAGKWKYWLRGPARTDVIVGDDTEARSLTCGWKRKHVAMVTQAIADGNQTSFTVNDATNWAAIARPFEVAVGNAAAAAYERMLICYVDTGTHTLYVGNSNGASAACASTNGRNAGGTSFTYHLTASHGVYVFLRDGAPILQSQVLSSTTSFTLDDASGIPDGTPSILQVGVEYIRVCNKSGNTLTIGTAAWPCAASNQGHHWRGSNVGWSNGGTHQWEAGVPVRIADGSDTWADAPSNLFKSIEPRAHVAFPTGWSGVGVKFIMLGGVWTDRMQHQRVDIAASVGGSSVYSKTEVEFTSRTILGFPVYSQADRMYWSGTAPGRVRINNNEDNCYAAGPCLTNPTVTMSAAQVNAVVNTGYVNQVSTAPAWTSGTNDKCEADTSTSIHAHMPYYWNGPAVRTLNVTGGRDELLHNKWMQVWMKSWRTGGTAQDTMEEMALSLPGCAGKIPYFYLEHNNSRLFCDGWAYPANTSDKACSGGNLTATTFGRILSPIAYPQLCPANQNLVQTVADRRIQVGGVTSAAFVVTITGSWSHNPTMAFYPAMFTSDYYPWLLVHLLGGVALTANDFAGGAFAAGWDPNDNTTARTNTRGPWAVALHNDGLRRWAYQRRAIAHAWMLSLEGSPEEQVFQTWLNRDTAVLEGRHQLATGSFYQPCPEGTTAATSNVTPYCWGYHFRGLSAANPSWGSEPGWGWMNPQYVNPLRTFGFESPFMIAYMLIQLADEGRLGYTASRPLARAWTGAVFVRKTVHPLADPFTLSTYNLPFHSCVPEGTDVSPDCSGQVNTPGRQQSFSLGMTGFANWLAAVKDVDKNAVKALGDNDSNLQSGYSNLVRGALEVNPDSDWTGEPDAGRLRWRDAMGWWQRNLRNQNRCSDNPYWCFGLRIPPSITIDAGDTSAKMAATTVYGTCKVAIQTSAFVTHDDSGDATATMVVSRLDHAFTGLTPATTYYWRASCGTTRRQGTFTTLAATSAARTLPLSLKPPSGRGIDNVLVAHGPTSALGSSVTASCASGCTPTISGLTAGEAVFFQVTYRDASNNALAVGRITSRIVQ